MKLNLNIMNIQGSNAVHGQRLHSSPIGTNEEEHPVRIKSPFRRWRPAFDRGADSLDLNASERPVPDDNPPCRYTGTNSFNKDWYEG